MIEVYVLSAALVALAGFVVYLSIYGAREARNREKELYAIIRRLENRIHAKDVTTYHQLEKADREIPESNADKAARLEQEAKHQEIESARYYAGNGHY